jgi:hypothetical protein
MLGSMFQAVIVPAAASPAGVANANTLNDQGLQQWRVGRRSEAVAAFSAACRVDRSFAVPWHNRGAIYLTEGQYLHAIDELKEAARLAPDWTLPRTHLAQAYLRTGDATAALAVSDAARALDPTLPDIRNDLRGVLQARLRMASELAGRRRTYFVATLALAVLVTFLTAGLGIGALALPIYRYYLYSQARRAADTARAQVRTLDSAPALRSHPPSIAAARTLGGDRPASRSIVPYLVAGTLPPFASGELEASTVTGTGFRRAGWPLLIVSILATAAGVYLVIVGNGGGAVSFLASVEHGTLVVFGWGVIFVGGLFASIAVLVGAVAAFRRKRTGWAFTILLLGGFGVFLIVPAQLMTLVYLFFMPPGSTTSNLEFLPVPHVSLADR